MCHTALGDYEAARKLYEGALGLYEQIGDEASRGNALGNLGLTQEATAIGGNPAFALKPTTSNELLVTAIENHRRALEIYEAAGDRVGGVRARYNMGRALLTAGDTDAALTSLREALALADDLKLEDWAIRALGALGAVHLHRDEIPDARDCSREAVERLSETTIPDSDEIHFARYLVLSSCGERAKAKQHLDIVAGAASSRVSRIRDEAIRERFLSGLGAVLEGEVRRRT
jgi:tetratricopeptide (TPR) repeat protein